MCGTSYMEEDTTRNQSESEAKSVTSKREDKKGTVVDLLNGGQKQRRKRQISTEVIVLDSDDDDDEPDSRDAVTPRLAKKARRSSSSSSSETIEIDIDCKPEATRKSSEVCVIDVDRSVVTPASLQKKPSPSGSVLNFVVSKNSGRVSLYSAKTGQPLHFNFDIDQLLTAETADSLLNAQVKRSSSQVRESGVLEKDVKFRDNSVQQGKFDPDSLGELVKSIIVSLPLLGFNSRL
jgi:hypothetical protein